MSDTVECRHESTFEHYDTITDVYLICCRDCGDVTPADQYAT